jgi:cytoskeleton protein RodZ
MPDDATRDIGAYLREARERAGLTLREVAAATKISVQALEAHERNDVSRLPGGIFVRAFVRAYAKHVGLDPDDAVRRFTDRFPDAAVDESRSRHEANPEPLDLDAAPASGRLWRAVGWSLPIVLVIVYFSFGGRLSWWGVRGPSGPRQEAQAEQVPPGPTTPILTTPATLPPPAQAAPAGTAEGAVAPPPDAEARAAMAATLGDESQGTAAREGRFQLTLASRGLCWVTVRSNGVIVFTSTMKAGERKDVDVWGRVSLTVGNAGVIDMAINGQSARSLGGEGQVVTVLLNIDNLKNFLGTR